MIPPEEQWFCEYMLAPGTPVIVVDAETKAVKGIGWKAGHEPAWGPTDRVFHAHHPDFFHPDPRVRIAHHRANLTSKLTACGARLDARSVVIDAHGEGDRCPACVRAIEAALEDHDRVRQEREKNAE